MTDLLDRLQKKKIQESGGDLIDRLNATNDVQDAPVAPVDPTAAGIPSFEGLLGFEGRTDPNKFVPEPLPEKTNPTIDRAIDAANRVPDRAASMITQAAGAPVDVVTSLINQIASGGNTDSPLIDPEQTFMGSAKIEEFSEGTQEGLKNVGRGVGLADKQTPEEIAAQRKKADESLAFAGGELFGEVAPFVVPGSAIAKLSLIPRAITAGLITAFEGGVVSKGRGGSNEDIQKTAALGGGLGVAMEIISPVIGRVASKVYRKLTNRAPKGQLVDASGNATEELVKVLDDAGLTVDDIQDQVMKEIRDGAVPEQAERAARFKQQGIPTTRGVITQDDVLLGREQTLLGRTDDVGGVIAQPLRERRIATSDAFIRNADELVEDLGVADDVGNSIKDALTQRRKLLVKEKNALYAAAAEADPELLNVPIISDTIVEAIPDRKIFNRINRIKGSQAEGVKDLLVEFGLDQSPDAVEAFTKNGGIIEPLSFSNFEDFRQGLNALARADQSKATNVLVGPILDVLDDELDTAFKAVTETSQQSLDGFPIGKTILDDAGNFVDKGPFKGRLFHQTNEAFDKFDFNKSADGTIWFSSNIDDLKTPGSAAAASTGNKNVVTANVTLKKPANFDDLDRFSVDELIRDGYDGAILGGDIQVFDPSAINVIKENQSTTLDLMKQARAKVTQLKVEFDPQDIAQKIIAFKKGGNVQGLEASQIFKTITKPSTTPEATGRLVKTLLKGGKNGRKALGDLQASVVFDALENSINTISNKSGGKQLFNANTFIRELNKLDKGGKLDVIFANNKGSLKALRNLKRSAQDTITPGTTMPKGSAPAVNAILGVLSGARSIVGISQLSDAVEIGVQSARTRNALNAAPAQRKTIEYISREYPALASVLGVGIIANEVENDK